jgi:Flp pilus assembly pilin Flp
VRTTGQSTVEYGLIVATIAVLVLIGALGFGESLREWFEVLVQRITGLRY